ncbi:MAG: RAMP superfamily CRISPR-associated protein [Thermoplasmatales archaeon]|nr:RAMP superfamily CRISPR-associated protein [Candidatus Methanoperedenaceae archaeon]MCG2827311.1 RAMP superfamily CRISPR-associated protein [Thermoplasmatales archaeon]
MKEESVIGKFIINGKLHLESPLIIGSGRDEFVDIEVLKDETGVPFIPATSVIGVLRHYFEDNFPENKGDDFNYFWGISEKRNADTQKSIQSAFICHDLYAHEAKIRVRDGVRIDPSKQIAADEAKYDFEIIEKGAIFNLLWEVTLRQIYNKDSFKRMLATIMFPLKNGTISIGAKTNNGFGKCVLKDINVTEFDFKEKEDVYKWLMQDFSHGKPDIDSEPYKKNSNIFSIEGRFAVKNSIIIRAYSEKFDMPDATNITSNGEFVLPGTSLKGAIRNRALKILKTFMNEGAEKKINHLFGIAGKKENDEKIKSRVQVEERVIKSVKPELQTRIKIDRFTGGTVKTALFNSMPLWNENEQDESIIIKINIRDYQNWEAGLMLQVLKDIWCEDLPIGGEKNVGRGILKGISAIIEWENRETHERRKLEIKSGEKGVLFSDESAAKELNDFASNFQMGAI